MSGSAQNLSAFLLDLALSDAIDAQQPREGTCVTDRLSKTRMPDDDASLQVLASHSGWKTWAKFGDDRVRSVL